MEQGQSSTAEYLNRFGAGARQVTESFYELERPSGNTSLQLLFFHGLQFEDFGNVHLSTWESRDGSCIWPQEWLVEKFPGSHVLYVKYDGRVGKRFRNSVMDISISAENLVSDLIQAHIGQAPGCPVILVGHSVGGLVIKEVCCHAHERLSTTQGPDKDKLQRFLNNVQGIFFYSTPHHGSPIAEKAVDLCVGPLRNYFKILSTEAARLNYKFDRVRKMYPKLQTEGVGESLPTRLGNFDEFFIVPEASSRLDNFNVVDEADHFTICKPITKTTRSYYKLENFLSRIVVNIKAQGTTECPENFQFVPDSVIGTNGPRDDVIRKLATIPRLGLVGMGGAGKTTLAKTIFNKMGHQFEYTCFVLNVKLIRGDEEAVGQEVWKQMHHHGRKVSSGENWVNLRGKKLPLALDDISTDRDAKIILKLAKDVHSESRFIMTSRDKNLVHYWEGVIYEVPFLKEGSAMELFQSFAFPGQRVPRPELEDILKAIVRKCDGLPLALEIVGKSLRGKPTHNVWEDTLHALDEAEEVKDLDERLWAKLRPSYEALGSKEQQMFLDATTFFSTTLHPWTLGEALAAWRAAHDSTCIRLLWGTLVGMSLVYEVKDEEHIKVHEQLQSLGRKIACEPINHKKWRVWDGKKGLKMLQSERLLNGKELYALRLEAEDEHPMNIPSSALLKQRNLRFLETDVPVTLDEPEEDGSFPTELVLLKCVCTNLLDAALQSNLAVLYLEKLERVPSSVGHLSSIHTVPEHFSFSQIVFST